MCIYINSSGGSYEKILIALLVLTAIIMAPINAFAEDKTNAINLGYLMLTHNMILKMIMLIWSKKIK